MGTKDTQEYSLDGGEMWIDASAGHTQVMFIGGETVIVREKATSDIPASVSTSPIKIAEKTAAPSNIALDIENRLITGTTVTQEYSLDGGLTWQDATASTTTVVFNGGAYVVIREKATVNRVASSSATFSSSVRLEAENAIYNTGLGNHPQSSGGKHLHSFDAVGKYVDFSNIVNNRAEIQFFTISYAAPTAGKIGLYINDIRHDFYFERSDTFSEKTMAIAIPENATVKLQFDAGDQWVNLDYIEYRY